MLPIYEKGITHLCAAFFFFPLIFENLTSNDWLRYLLPFTLALVKLWNAYSLMFEAIVQCKLCCSVLCVS